MEDELLEELWFSRHYKKEYIEEICETCRYFEYNIAGHPGGHSTATTHQNYCILGYWEDIF